MSFKKQRSHDQERRGLLLGFYGDDFTGSTDAMEALARVGLRTALFTKPPREGRARGLENLDVVGVTGNTRSLPTDEMETALRPAFASLRRLAAPIVHYKVCSTFDSSPSTGSIGRAIDVGAEMFDSEPVPIVVGAPVLGRYCVFGNLFARSGLDSEPYRLDRHPTMRHHPVTPMNESDLRRHLARQTPREIALLDILRISGGSGDAIDHYRTLAASRPGAILIDLLFEEQLRVVGDVLRSQTRSGRTLYVVGSSGVEMALAASWQEAGVIRGPVEFPPAGRAEPLLVLSGSCSPVTRDQNEWALAKGFAEVPLATARLALREGDAAAEERVVATALDLLGAGRSVVVHTAHGPDDPRIGETRACLAEELSASSAASETADSEAGLKALCGERLGTALGRVGGRILEELDLRRVVITGGDSSWHAARELGIESLEMVAPMAPGSPLCRAHGAGSPADGVELVFKGGQVGRVDLLERTLLGEP